MKSRVLYAVVIIGLALGLAACQCGGKSKGPACAPNCTYADMTLCYPQLGAESDWRTANTASFKETAEELGFKLVFSDAQQKQENQISAMRACIQQKVDVIALPPVVEDGWEQVLTEAKNAGIPVIIVDRSVSADSSLYASHIGSDMVLEGERAAEEFNKLMPDGGAVLELSGTTGSGAAVGRAKGFRNKLNENITILDSQTGNFTRAEAK
ncbi:MAG: substrate-binding domain-containing protein, partial [Anaerolineae bacterium]